MRPHTTCAVVEVCWTQQHPVGVNSMAGSDMDTRPIGSSVESLVTAFKEFDERQRQNRISTASVEQIPYTRGLRGEIFGHGDYPLLLSSISKRMRGL